jgi:hypothetical protein
MAWRLVAETARQVRNREDCNRIASRVFRPANDQGHVLRKGVSIMQVLTRKNVIGRRPLLQTSDEFVQVSRVGRAAAYRPVSKRQLSVLALDDDRDTSESLSILVAIWGRNACVARDSGLIFLGVLPTWGHSRSWGYGPSKGLGLVLVVVLVVVVMNRI